jgi:hypothetical protein
LAEDDRLRVRLTGLDKSTPESPNTNIFTARTSLADAPYFSRTSSNESGVASDPVVM